ncbi:hypothetical protein [Methanosphaerula palustris]|nr:hypothetical protein [Methanosphaerula palustris]
MGRVPLDLDLSTIEDGIWAYTIRVSTDDPSVAVITTAEPPSGHG